MCLSFYFFLTKAVPEPLFVPMAGVYSQPKNNVVFLKHSELTNIDQHIFYIFL